MLGERRSAPGGGWPRSGSLREGIWWRFAPLPSRPPRFGPGLERDEARVQIAAWGYLSEPGRTIRSYSSGLRLSQKSSSYWPGRFTNRFILACDGLMREEIHSSPSSLPSARVRNHLLLQCRIMTTRCPFVNRKMRNFNPVAPWHRPDRAIESASNRKLRIEFCHTLWYN